MRAIHPPPSPGDPADDGSDGWLATHYPDPDGAGDGREIGDGDPHTAGTPATGRPHVRALMVSSADGAVELDGGSTALATGADRRVFGFLRRRADVILAGAGTVRAEDYRGARRGRDGGPPPPIAVVTSTARLDPGSRLFTDTRTAPIVLTTAAAPAARRTALADAGADVAVLPDLSPSALLAELGRRGLRRVLCEGGPVLLGSLVGADAVDELCLTLSPLVTAGQAARIAASDVAAPRRMHLAGVLEEEDTLLLRYTRSR